MSEIISLLPSAFIVPLFTVMILILIIRAYLKAITTSNFDRLFLPKDQMKWNELVNFMIKTFITSILVTSYFYFLELSTNIFTSTEKAPEYFYLIVILLFLISSIIILILSARTNVEKFINLLPKRVTYDSFLAILLSTNSILLAFIVFKVAFLFVDNIQPYALTVFERFFIVLALIYLATIIFAKFYYEIVMSLLKLRNRYLVHYKMLVLDPEDQEQKEPYVLYSLDANTLVLSDKSKDYESSYLYLYDKNSKEVMKFRREEIRVNDEAQPSVVSEGNANPNG